MDDRKNLEQQYVNEGFLEHSNKEVAEINSHFSVEPSGQKDFDIFLMTGNNGESGDKK